VGAARLPVMHTRDTAFSYRCHACNRCCYGKRIQVNPYELVRLARMLGTTTTDVIAHFTVDGGTALATRSDTACVFLGPDGCTVHSARPLVCRLYPLGRIVQADGSETFVEVEPHPQTEGVYGEDGTIGAFVASQGVASYIAAADRYYAVMTQLLSGSAPGSAPSDASDVSDAGNLADATALGTDTTGDIDARLFIDADLAVRWDAERGGAMVPGNDYALVDRHLTLVKRWADQLAATE
jgi:uncharacterized protein